MDLATCIDLVKASMSNASSGIISEFKESDIQVLNGSYGPYIKHAGQNYRLPKGTDAQNLTEDQCKEIIANSEPTGKRKGRRK